MSSAILTGAEEGSREVRAPGFVARFQMWATRPTRPKFEYPYQACFCITQLRMSLG